MYNFFLFHFPSYNQDEDEVPSALAEAMPSFVKFGLVMPEGLDVNTLKVPDPKDHPSSSTPSFSGMPNQKAAWNTKFTEKCEK